MMFAGLQVAMNHAMAMGAIQRIRHLNGIG
jgi:hypothetical protein